MSRRFLVMAGGTGGHVYPALGFAHLAHQKGHQVEWLGTANGLEARVVPENQIQLHCIDIAGVRGKGLKSLIGAPFSIARAIGQARSVLKKVKPDLVIGFGGYSAGPGGVAARIARIPLVIHEQNAKAGTTNKLLSRIASAVLCAFENALPGSQIVGNPVREDILQIAAKSAEMIQEKRPVRLLVLGGSLGARFLNETVPQVLAGIDEDLRPSVRHQAGIKLLAEARLAYEKHAIQADISAYIEDMAEAYHWADMVVCRAGAMTVSELAAVGLPALFIPFPYAIDDHQTANAHWLVDEGAADMYQQSENDLGRFSLLLTAMLADKNKLVEMATCSRKRGVRDASQRILQTCEELADVA